MRRVEAVRTGLLVGSIAFLAFMGLSIRPAGTRPLEAGGEVAETLVREAGGVRDRIRFRDFVWDENRKDGGSYRLTAAEALGFPDSGEEVFRLKDVRFETKEDAGARALTLRAPRAEFHQASRAVTVFDGVAVEGEGMRLRSSSFQYDPVARTFTSGSAVSASHGGLLARAAHGVLMAKEGSVRLSGDVRVRGWEAGRLLDLSAAEAVLRKAGAIEATGGVVVRTPEATIRGRRVDRTTSPDGGDSLHATGNVLVFALPAAGSLEAPAQAEADVAELSRDRTGAPTSLLAERHEPRAVLRLAPGAASGARKAVSESFVASFVAGRLRGIVAPGAVEISESAFAPAQNGAGLRVLQAGFARLELAAAGNALSNGSFEKGVTLRDGTRATLRAASGHLDGAKDEATFSEGDGRPATYQDERGTIEAATLRWLRKEEVLDAQGNVRTASVAGGRIPIPGGQAGEPYYSESDRLRLSNADRAAVLTGNVRVWQKENVLRCAQLTAKDSDRSVHAEGSVRAAVKRSAQKGAGQKEVDEIVHLSGDRMDHKEADRVILVEGHSAVSSGSWGLTSENLDVRLTEAREIDKADARGSVVVEERTTHRRGEGSHATWEAKTETVTLDGSPATAIDGKGNRLTGARLTFRQGQSRVDVQSRPGVGSEGWFRPEGSGS